MDLKGKLEAEVEIKSPGDLFHELYINAPHEMCDVHPEFIQSCDLHDGEIGKTGAILVFNYTLDGKPCMVKERIETIDEEEKIIKVVVVEGDLLEEYKSFEVTTQVFPKGEGVNVVKWTVEYEKLHEGVDDPHALIDEAIKLTKKIEDHHLQA